MPPSYSTVSSSERVLTVHPERVRTSSAGGAAARSSRSPPSSAGSRSYHSGSVGSDGWTDLGGEEDELEPNDSASRARQPSLRRGTSEARPEPKRRHSSRRSVLQTEAETESEPQRRHSSRRHHSSRSSRHRHADSRRVPSNESSSTVASQDDYPHYSHHGRYPPPSGYRNVPAPAPPQSHGGYAPSMTATPGYAEAYAPPHQALVHMQPPQDAFGYPQANPFGSMGQGPNPFSPMGSTTGSSSYFASEPLAPPMQHHRPSGAPRPQSYIGPSSHYGSEMMSPYAGMPPYGPYAAMLAGMQGFHPMPGWYPQMPSQPSPAPPAAKEEKKEEKNEQIEALKALIQKQEEAHVAREKAMIKKAEEEAAAVASAKAREEEEKKKKEEIAAASKKAKEDAEKTAEENAKKAKDEHEKKLKEAEEAKAVAEKKQKEFEEQVAKLKPSPDMGKQIKFKDAVGRKFSFPFHLCKTWKGMEGLIRQAFLHVDVIGDHVRAGHFDLTGPDGEIILPQVWDACIQPDWEISMHMWPMEEKKEEHDPLADPFAALGLADILGDVHQKKPPKGKKSGGGKKEKKAELLPMPPPPPPANYPPGLGGILPNPMVGLDLFPPAPPKTKKSGSSKKKEPSGFSSWFSAGSSAPKKKK